MTNVLSLTLWLPIAAAVLLVVFPKTATNAIKGFVLLASIATFIASLGILGQFKEGVAGFQLVESLSWIPQWGIRYSLGVDGISLWLILLTTLLTPVVFLSSWNTIHKHPKEYVIAFLIMEAAMIGVFVASDLLLFYVFFELTLLPMYLVIGVWGGANRIYAAIKFFLFTIAGSLLMLLGIIYLAFAHFHDTGVLTFTITELYGTSLAPHAQVLLFFAFALAFAIKVPLFPLHTWLPDAHVEAPTGGSIILAGVMLKMGTYGFLRFVLPLFPDATAKYAGLLIALAVIGVIYERRHTRLLADYGGLAKTMPVFATFFIISMLSSVGLPGLNGFVGEFLILAGSFQTTPRWTIIAATGVILAAIYLLWLIQRVFFGPITNDENRNVKEIAWNEIAALVPLVVLMVWIGVRPNTFLRKMTPSVQQLLQIVHKTDASKAMIARSSLPRHSSSLAPDVGGVR